MPTYQYRCRECDHDFEVVQSFTDDPLESCPECQGSLKKVYGNVGISFKGSGFYKTDSRSAARIGGGSSTSTKESTDSGGPGSGSSDSGGSDSGGPGSGGTESGSSDAGSSDSGKKGSDASNQTASSSAGSKGAD